MTILDESAGMLFVCNECGKTFRKKITGRTYEVQCPKCHSDDVEIIETPSKVQEETGEVLESAKWNWVEDDDEMVLFTGTHDECVKWYKRNKGNHLMSMTKSQGGSAPEVGKKVESQELAWSLSESVASSFKDMENVLIGKGVRVSWGGSGWRDSSMYIEELPAKGKKRVRRTDIGTGYAALDNDDFLMLNLVQHAKIGKGMDYDAVLAAMKGVVQGVEATTKGKSDLFWYETEVNPMNVEPEDYEPIKVMGKDFGMTAKWTSFEAYSPSSDLAQMDPHYSIIKASSPTAARKLFKMAKADPELLKEISWFVLDDWMKGSGIQIKHESSVWH